MEITTKLERKESCLSLPKKEKERGKKKSEMVTNKIPVQYFKTGEYENIDY